MAYRTANLYAFCSGTDVIIIGDVGSLMRQKGGFRRK